jgi:hypothetical protein
LVVTFSQLFCQTVFSLMHLFLPLTCYLVFNHLVHYTFYW